MAKVQTIGLALLSWNAFAAILPEDVRNPGCAGVRGPDGVDHTICRPPGAKPEQALCIHDHHCACAGGLVCADSLEDGECAGPGESVFCIPMPEPEPGDAGSNAVTDAESSMSDIGCVGPAGDDATPCRPEGAQSTQAFCVFGDHCACYTGYVCADTLEEGECSPGTGGAVFCVPRDEKILGSHGDTPADNASLQPVSGCLGAILGENLCLPLGASEDQAMCVFGDHCLCTGGLVCEDTLALGECGPGSVCVSAPGTTTTTTRESSTQRLSFIAALVAAAFSFSEQL